MKRVAMWIWDHWWLAGMAIGLGIAMLWSRRLSPAAVAAQLKLETEAIAAKGEARKAQARLGAERARDQVEITYRSEVIALDAQQKQQAYELRKDPVALAEFLVKAGSVREKGSKGPW